MSLGGGTSSPGLVASVASVRRTVAYHGVGPASTRLVWSCQVLRRSSQEGEVVPPGLWVEASPVHSGWDWWWGCWDGSSVHGGLGVAFQLLEKCWHLFTDLELVIREAGAFISEEAASCGSDMVLQSWMNGVQPFLNYKVLAQWSQRFILVQLLALVFVSLLEEG